MKTQKNICPNCKSEFILRRSDQKYCTSKCRSRYHNKTNVINIEIVKKITNLVHEGLTYSQTLLYIHLQI